VDDECEFQHLWVVQVRGFHLEQVRSVVDEGHQVALFGNREGVVEDFIQNIMRKSGWCQLVVLGELNHIFMKVYCKQVPKMRQLVCMSTDVYCQILNNQQYAESSYLYSNRKKGKQARCWRDRERVCV
jgi:hypothetical protein